MPQQSETPRVQKAIKKASSLFGVGNGGEHQNLRFSDGRIGGGGPGPHRLAPLAPTVVVRSPASAAAAGARQ